MAEIFTPTAIQTFTNDTTAVNAVNNNFTAISNILQDVLSRSGTSPNQMTSTLDMNSNSIINLPPPTTVNSPARLADVLAEATIASIPPTGTSGHVVPFLDGNNTWSGTNLFSSISSAAFGSVIATQLQVTNSVVPDVRWYNPSGGTDLKYWSIAVNTTDNSLSLRALNDAYTTSTNAFTCTRSAGNVTSVIMPVNITGGALGSFWTDITDIDGTANAKIHQFRDRLFVDDGALNSGAWAGGTGGLANSRSGSAINSVQWNWAPREASLLAISSWGELAVVGMSVASSAFRTGDPHSPPNSSAVGISGFGLNDRVTNLNSVWGGYFESLRKYSTAGNALTIELDTGTTSVVDITPYVTNPSGMSIGIWNQSGGSAGGAVTYTNTTAGLVFGSNGSKWRKGIVFTAAGLDQSLGAGGTGLAIEFGDGQSMRWANVAAQIIGEIWSTSTGTGTMVLQPRTLLQINGTGTWTGNGSVATTLGSLGPTGSHTSPQVWFVVLDNTGTTRYIPAF